MKHLDSFAKTNNDIEESYDDHDFVDTYDYDQEEDDPIIEGTENDEDDENDSLTDDLLEKYLEDEELENEKRESSFVYDTSEKREYGSVKGIRNYTDPTFDLDKATKLFYEGDEKDQIEALLYAQFYARKMSKCKDAHMFIMQILTKDVDKCLSHDVYEQAQMSFYYFFRTYLLRECQKFAESRGVDEANKREYVDEALQHCHASVFKALPGYKIESGFAISTYFQPFIKDALTTWESLCKGRSSKSTMRTDAIIANAQKELLAEGIVPTPELVAIRCRKKVEETTNSMTRIKAENTMISSEANNLVVGAKKQNTFIDPDKKMIQSELTSSLISALKKLRPDQREVLCYTLGIDYDEHVNMILDSSLDKLSLKQIAERMNLDVGEVKALQVSAKRIMEREMRSYTDSDYKGKVPHTKDTFLHDRHMIFSSSKEDDDIMEIIGEIDHISDSLQNETESETIS